ncbi:MAG: MFS transporter, partial [Sphingomonadales bacterium]
MRVRVDRTFALLFTVMLTIAAGNTALQSVLPALGRSLGVADSAVAAVFSISALLWVIAAPFWANRSDRHGRRAMVLLGVAGFTFSLLGCGIFLALGINGVIAPLATFIAFIFARMIYGALGSAAPPAVQALVAGRTTREERTKALTLIASAFGLGTILGPAIAPYLVLGRIWEGGPLIGLSGPAFFAAAIGAALWIAVVRLLPHEETASHGAAASYPSIGGQGSGATVTAAMAEKSEPVGFFDPRIRAWIIAGLVIGHAQAMTGQAIGFLVIDRLNLAPAEALQPTGIVLMIGALAALLVQWGIIPNLDLRPRAMMLVGLAVAAVGCALTG